VKNFKKIIGLLTLEERRRFFFILIIFLISGFIDVFGVASIMPFVAVLSKPELVETNKMLGVAYKFSQNFGVNTNNKFLFILGLFSFLIFVFSMIFKSVALYVQLRFIVMRECTLSQRLLEGYVRQPYAWFLNRNSSELGKNILSEVSRFITFALLPMITFISNFILAIVLIILIIFIDPIIAFVSFVVLSVAYFIIYKSAGVIVKQLGKKSIQSNKLRFGTLQELFGAIKELKVRGLEQPYIDRYSLSAQTYAKSLASSQIISLLPKYFVEAVAFGGIIILVLVLLKINNEISIVLPIISLYVFAGYKLMPALQQGRDTPLAACFEYSDEHAAGFREAQGLRDLVLADEIAAKVVEVARGLEGLKRSDGIHAAAVVITGKPLMDYLPIQRKGNDAPIVTQYEMHAVESLGLLKMDFLGLRNLDVIADAVEMIREQTDPDFDIDIISLEDTETFELLGRGDTIGVFQLESLPMQSLLRLMRPTAFEDVCAVIALYRPGPMSTKMHTTYAKIKNNIEEPEYFHEDAREVLHDTYGLMVYQESMMRVAQKFAGYSLAQADNLRKACGKKDPRAMAAEEGSFVDGCEKTGYGRPLGEKLFDIIRGFADYAFNKSHAYGYGLIAYQTAYLKAHFPVEYSACLLSSVKGNYEKAAVHLADARSIGITVSNPDINEGRSDFAAITADGQKRIVFALSGVRNVGEGIVLQILEERDRNGPYESFHDFARRAPEQALNKRAVESLIKAGAFDSFGHPRRGLLMVFESIIDSAVVARREEEKGVMSLFGEMEDASTTGWSAEVSIPDMQFTKPDQLRHEKEMLGLYISDHPLRGIEHALRRLVTSSIQELEARESGMVTIGGVMSSLNRRFTKKGDQMATFVLEDMDAAIEVTVFAKVLGEYGHLLSDDLVVTVTGRLNQRDDAPPSFSAQRVSVPENLGDKIAEVELSLPSGFTAEKLERLKAIIAEFPGTSPCKVKLAGGKVFDLGPSGLVDFEKALGPLRVTFGSNAVKII
jgi:hypothetical protein